ncbi:MAG: exo-alpha-sialidase [Pirellulales bacterium]
MNCPSLRLTTTSILLLGLSLSAIAFDDTPSKAPFRIASRIFQPGDDNLGLEKAPGQDVILYRATDDGYKFCHHPNLVVFRDKLFCMWSNGIVGEDLPGQRILISTSSDGLTWTEPTMLTDHQRGKGICVAAGFHVFEETLVAYCTATGGTNFHQDTALLARTSCDGQSWSEPHKVTGGFFLAGPRRLPRGRLLLSGDRVGSQRTADRMLLLYSDQPNGLGGWREARIDLRNPKDFGYTEPCHFLRKDETVVMAFRNYSGHLFASVSSDSGESWTTPVETGFPDSTARFSTGQLPDGTTYLINNPGPTQFDRSRLTIALSENGTTFDRALLLRGESTKKRYEGQHKIDGWQYPHAVCWNGHFYVAYSINKEDIGVTRIALTDLITQQ